MWVVRGERRLEVGIGQHFALLPIGGPARVTSHGIAFPLADEVLSPFDGRGIANEATESVVSLTVSEGVVLVISCPVHADDPNEVEA